MHLLIGSSPNMQRPRLPKHSLLCTLGSGLCLVLALCLASPGAAAPAKSDSQPVQAEEKIADLDRFGGEIPTLDEFGHFLSLLEEWEKNKALNVLADLASDARLEPKQVGSALRELLQQCVGLLGES